MHGSPVARLQQATTLGIVALAGAWLFHEWPSSPARAVAGALAVALSYLVLMATQCALMWMVNCRVESRPPAFKEVLHAWWGEVLQVPQVFFWRQPFRWRDWPDLLGPAAHGRRGIVFIHGFLCNRGFWLPWLRRAHMQGTPYIAVNLEPVFGSIDEYAPLIDDAVRRLTDATGVAPMLVCHSMGGLAARAWLRASGGATGVHRIITIGSPHHGTWLARMSSTANGRQMRLQSRWLNELARDEADRPRPALTCWYTHCDNIVFPAATATLPGADNRLVPGPAHVELAFHPSVIDGTWALLDTPAHPTRSA